MKFLIIVNESPWGSGLSLSACRFVTAVIASGSQVHAIFFREDGVYNAVKGAMVDSGTPDLSDQWDAFNRNHGTRLLLCSSSTQRRLDKSVDQPFEISGLTEMLELTTCCDRVVSF